MRNNRLTGTNRIDDKLANFTDQLLAGESPEEAEMTEEMRVMAMTVQEIRQAFGDDKTDMAMAARIRASIASEWGKSSSKAAEAPVWRRWLESVTDLMTVSASSRQFAMLGAAASIMLVFWCALAGSAGGGSVLTGSAGGLLGNSVVPFAFVGGMVVLAGVVWWLLKPRD
jgi:hypothetical protein